jgi:hypothetical protein
VSTLIDLSHIRFIIKENHAAANMGKTNGPTTLHIHTEVMGKIFGTNYCRW